MDIKHNGQRTYTLVVGVDYSELGDLALERACELAERHPRTHLHVIHVGTMVSPSLYGIQAAAPGELERLSTRLHEHVEAIIERWCEAHASAVPFERLTTHVRADGASAAIAQLASDVAAELVIVGTHGRRGAQRLFLGSVAEATVRLAPCAVLVVRQPIFAAPKIEAPCPRCVETRRTTDGHEFWCEQHREHHERRHTYHYKAAPGARQSGLLIHAG